MVVADATLGTYTSSYADVCRFIADVTAVILGNVDCPVAVVYTSANTSKISIGTDPQPFVISYASAGIIKTGFMLADAQGYTVLQTSQTITLPATAAEYAYKLLSTKYGIFLCVYNRSVGRQYVSKSSYDLSLFCFACQAYTGEIVWYTGSVATYLLRNGSSIPPYAFSVVSYTYGLSTDSCITSLGQLAHTDSFYAYDVPLVILGNTVDYSNVAEMVKNGMYSIDIAKNKDGPFSVGKHLLGDNNSYMTDILVEELL